MKGINLLEPSKIENKNLIEKKKKIFVFSLILFLAFFLFNLGIFLLRIRQNKIISDLDFKINQKKISLSSLKEKEIKYRFLKDRLEKLTKLKISNNMLFDLFNFLTEIKNLGVNFNNVNYQGRIVNLTINELSIENLVNLINYLEAGQEGNIFEKIMIENLVLKSNGYYSLSLSFLLNQKI